MTHLEELIEQVESYDFECEAGTLQWCKDWHKLKEYILCADIALQLALIPKSRTANTSPPPRIPSSSFLGDY